MITERYCLDLLSPARGFMDSFLLGNGRLGATVRGGVGEERIDINLDRLWSGGPLTEVGSASPADLLPELRRAVRKGNASLADEISQRMQGQGWTQSYQPLSGLRFKFEAGEGPIEARGYRRRLDLSNATAEHHYDSGNGNVVVTSFVSGPHDIAVTTVTAQNLPSLDSMVLAWDCVHPSTVFSWTEAGTRWTRIIGRAPVKVIPPYRNVSDPVTYGSGEPDADGTVPAGMGFCAVAALAPTEQGVRLIVAAECGFRGSFERPSADLEGLAHRAEATVRDALSIDVHELHKESIADYKRYFDRNDLQLPSRPELETNDPARAELLYHFGRYLLISSSRPGTEPANLQGIWNPYRRPAWSSNHTTNINTEMNYWPAQPTGLGDLAGPLVDMVGELVEAGKVSARHYYGAPGSVVHHNTDLWRFSQPVEGMPMWANWTAALPWLISHCWDQWDYNPSDDVFARERLLPMMAEIVRFTLFMLVEDDEGQLVVSPSSSPEHRFLGEDGRAWGVTEGSTMDQVLYRQVLERFVELSALLGPQTDLAREAVAALIRLRSPAVGGDGALCEWGKGLIGAEPGHRHFSHLYGLFPGNGISFSDKNSLIEGARQALDQRLASDGGRPGWSQSWILCMAARLGDSSLAQWSIRALLTELTTASLLVLHPYEGVPESAVFQIDGNFGATAGILEMLLQSHGDAVSLLSAIPMEWDRGSLTGGRARGGHVVDMTWDAGLVSVATVRAGRDGAISLDIPGDYGYEVTRVSDGAKCNVTTSQGSRESRQRVVWQMVSGEAYRVARQARPPLGR